MVEQSNSTEEAVQKLKDAVSGRLFDYDYIPVLNNGVAWQCRNCQHWKEWTNLKGFGACDQIPYGEITEETAPFADMRRAIVEGEVRVGAEFGCNRFRPQDIAATENRNDGK